MPNIVSLRYSVFGIFIACNAIIASIAVWNLSVAQVAQLKFPVVTYLIVVGALGLAVIFAIIFTELVRRHAITSRVWFEWLWASLFSVLEVSGAAAFSAAVPGELCSLSTEHRAQGSCVSTKLLLTFVWVCTSILLLYLLILAIACFFRYRDESSIWQCNIRDLPSFSSGRLRSAPPTPTLPRFINTGRPPSIVAPKPRHPPADLMNAYRSGLSPQYEIEHYQPPTIPTRAALRTANPSASFYPHAIQSLITQPAARSTTLQDQVPHQAVAPPSPPPLGDWPRVDAPLRWSRSRRSKTTHHDQDEVVAVPEATPLDLVSASPPDRRRPTGPRLKRSESDRRPPRLDLAGLSSFNP